MYDWLQQEIQTIKTRRFHVVDGPADAALREAVESSDAPIPRSYKEFVLRFGNAKLYRELDYYIVGVLASPRTEQSDSGDESYRIGHYQSSDAYFRVALLRGDDEAPVFEGHGGRLVQVAKGFEEWLRKRCRTARSKYSKREWERIVSGPPPFNAEECTIRKARRLFSCRATGFVSPNHMSFEVFNGSDMVLPYLSVGVQWESDAGELQGGIWLPVSHIGPGQAGTVEHEVYEGMADAKRVEVFVLPDPGPEERERYWEFRAMED